MLDAVRTPEKNYAPPFASDAHKDLAREWWGFVRGVESARTKSGRYTEWKHIENGLWRFKSIADLSGLERADRTVVLDLFEDMLHFPIMAGMIQTAVAVFWGMFTAQRPIFDVTARDPSDVLGAKLMQLKLDYEVDMKKALLHLMREFYDGIVYGFGVKEISYERTEKNKTFWRAFEGVDPATGESVVRSFRVKRPYVSYEGNSFSNVTPYNFGSDWHFPAYEIQKGSFVFHRFVVHLDDLMQNEDFKNLKEVEERIGKTVTGSEEAPGYSSRRQGEDRDLSLDLKKEGRLTDQDRKSKYLEVFKFQHKLIPKRRKLTNSTKMETWEGYITDSGVIVGMWPLDNDHGEFTYSAWAPIPYEEVDYPPSVAEMLRPLQDEINWLVNSNRISIRRSLNGSWVYDPHYIDENELKPARFAKWIKLQQRLAHGLKVGDVLTQIAYTDATQQNLANIPTFLDAMKQATGITDMVQGIPIPGRRTATESENLEQHAITRLQLLAGIMSITSLSDTARQMVANNQQYMTEQTWMRLGGDAYQEIVEDLARQGRDLNQSYLRVAPWEISGNFDFPTFSPHNPSASPAKVEAMARIFQELITAFPLLQKTGYTVDFGKLSREFGALIGVKNMGEIVKEAQGAPNIVESFVRRPQQGLPAA